VSAATQQQRAGIHPLAWSFLLITAGLLLASLLLSLQSPDWLDGLTLNPEQLRSLPEPLQADDLWRNALPPVLAAAAFGIASRWLPRRQWSTALVNGALLLVTLRYFAWRCTTLNTAHPFSLGCSVLQLTMEVVGLLILVLQLLPNPGFDGRRRSRQADQLQSWSAAHPASVAVWIPTYNEPERMVERAILTCRNLNHPRLRITVLDDGHRPAIAALAERHGVHYLSRDGNAHRKAGNLNHALTRCHEDFIAVFDCDFTPSPNFLQRTLGFFQDPRVALVQTPQHYFQPDFHSRNLGLDLVMPGDLDYFYHYLQPRRDQDNAVVCCGTSYVMRREALQSIGGYVTSCLVEDYQTSTKLISQGWKVCYLNEVLSMGEVPRTFADFLDQRLRWMQGNIQIYFCGAELPILRTLRFRQLRWYLLPADLLAPLWRVTYLFMPLLGLMLGFSVIAAPVLEFIAYGGPFLVALYTLPNWLSGHYHHQFWMEVYETLFCFPALARMRKVLLHPFRVYGGIVTNKEVAEERQRLNLRLSWPLLLLLVSVVLAITIRYLLPALDLLPRDRVEFDGEEVILAWNIYNAIVLSVAILACIDQPVTAGAEPFPIRQVARLDLAGAHLWGNTRTISEDEVVLDLQSCPGPLQRVDGPTDDGQAVDRRAIDQQAPDGQLQLLEPGLSLPVSLEHQQDGSLQLRIRSDEAWDRAGLLRLLYSRGHWFHAPRRLTTGDALLHWLRSLWRPDPLLRRTG